MRRIAAACACWRPSPSVPARAVDAARQRCSSWRQRTVLEGGVGRAWLIPLMLPACATTPPARRAPIPHRSPPRSHRTHPPPPSCFLFKHPSSPIPPPMSTSRALLRSFVADPFKGRFSPSRRRCPRRAAPSGGFSLCRQCGAASSSSSPSPAARALRRRRPCTARGGTRRVPC